MKKLVAVIGATGQTGKHIVQKLIEQNIPSLPSSPTSQRCDLRARRPRRENIDVIN